LFLFTGEAEDYVLPFDKYVTGDDEEPSYAEMRRIVLDNKMRNELAPRYQDDPVRALHSVSYILPFCTFTLHLACFFFFICILLWYGSINHKQTFMS